MVRLECDQNLYKTNSYEEGQERQLGGGGASVISLSSTLYRFNLNAVKCRVFLYVTFV